MLTVLVMSWEALRVTGDFAFSMVFEGGVITPLEEGETTAWEFGVSAASLVVSLLIKLLTSLPESFGSMTLGLNIPTNFYILSLVTTWNAG